MPSFVDYGQDYRTYIRAHLDHRSSANKQYSLRSFARDLGTTPPRLSEILSGKRRISDKTAAKFAEKLGLKDLDAEHFCALAQFDDATSSDARHIASIRLRQFRHERPDYRVLQEHSMRVISDWYHFAILELTLLEGFQSDPEWISSQLRISLSDTVEAIDRLVTLKLLAFEDGKLAKTTNHLTTSENEISEANRRFFRQLLGCARDGLISNAVPDRDFSAVMMPIDPQKIPEAQKRITKFRRELCDFLESGARTELYCFSAQLFRMTPSPIQGASHAKK